MTEPKPILSIIITSYSLDRLRDIFELLDTIKAQTYDQTETILVIERSTELLHRVKRFVEEEAIPNVKVVFNHGKQGQASARNVGIRYATGDIVAFVDDDAIPLPGWAEELVQTYEDDSVIGVTGPAFPSWEDESKAWFPEEFYWIVGGTAWFDSDEPREVRNAWGMNMSFRRKALDSCHFTLGHKAADDGTKIGIEGDDTELSMRVTQMTGRRIIFNPKVRVSHKVFKYRVTPIFIRRKAFWQGYTKAVLKRQYGTGGQESKVLATEYRLLRRILVRLFPSIAMGFFSHPAVAWRRLNFTMAVLSHLTLGYFSAVFPRLGTLTTRRYGSL